MSLNRTTRAPTRPNNTSTFGLVASLLLLLGLSACGEDSSTSTEDSGTEGFLCTDDLSCEQGQFCIDGQCTEAGDECRADGDCQPFERCRAGFCVEREGSCMADTDCASGEICNDFVCTSGCRVDTDCSTGQVCSDALVCVEPPPMCPESCPDHQTCIDPQAGCEPDGTCTTDNDCTGLDVCTGGLCGEAPVPCESSRDCVQGQYCDRENNICLPGCRTAGDCRSDELCLDNQCSTDDPPPCEPDDQEPNNSPAEGALLDPNANLEALTLCDDSDWYQFR
ncbi:MAG: hypothetical protein AAFX99_09440, partial [Myxococcota bacterium]